MALMLKSPASQGLHFQTDSLPMITTLFKELPPSFAMFTQCKLEKSILSKPETQMHAGRKYDIRKTIRIARDILNSRQIAQERLLTNTSEFHTLSPQYCRSLQEIAVEYFNVQFGNELLTISNKRILDFLESALMFSNHPLLGFITKFFFMDLPLSLNAELNLWLYVEGRKYLIMNHYVDVLQSEFTMEYITVRRVYALLCVNEMLRVRGKFGPRAVEDVCASVEAFPSIVSFENNDSTRDIIECEGFLELLCSEVVRLEAYSAQLLNEVMGVRVIVEAKGLLRSIPDSDHEELSRVLESWHIKLREVLVAMRGAFVKCIAHDDLRTGSIEFKVFCDTLLYIFTSSAPLNEDSISAETLTAIEYLASCFLDEEQQQVCYLDFVSVLLAHLINNEPRPWLDIDFALEAVHTVRRGLDDLHAQKLVAFVGYAQSLESAGLLWPFGSPMVSIPSLQSSVTLTGKGIRQSTLALKTEGVWHSNLNASSDGPGNLSVNRVTLIRKDIEGLPKDGASDITPYSSAATVPPVQREMINEFGERARIGGSVPHSKPVLHTFELTELIPPLNEGVYPSRDSSQVLKSRRPISPEIRESESTTSQREMSKGLKTYLLLSERREAEEDAKHREVELRASGSIEVHRRVNEMKRYENEMEARYELERSRFTTRRKLRSEQESKRLKAAAARDQLESRKARRLQAVKEEKLAKQTARVAVLEGQELREVALKEQEKLEKQGRDKLRREESRQHKHLQRLRSQRDLSGQDLEDADNER
jgi:hypothetical protein